MNVHRIVSTLIAASTITFTSALWAQEATQAQKYGGGQQTELRNAEAQCRKDHRRGEARNVCLRDAREQARLNAGGASGANGATQPGSRAAAPMAPSSPALTTNPGPTDAPAQGTSPQTTQPDPKGAAPIAPATPGVDTREGTKK